MHCGMNAQELAHQLIAQRYGRKRLSGRRKYDPDIAANLAKWADEQPPRSIAARAIKAMLFRYVER